MASWRRHVHIRCALIETKRRANRARFKSHSHFLRGALNTILSIPQHFEYKLKHRIIRVDPNHVLGANIFNCGVGFGLVECVESGVAEELVEGTTNGC